MNNLLETFEALADAKPNDGRALFEAAAKLNSFWFRNRLPECDAHDTMNLIDSEGEERFKPGMVDVFGSEKQFFEHYSKHYDDAIPKLRSVLKATEADC